MDVESAIRSGLVDLLKGQILKALAKNFPYFSSGIPGMIAGFLVGKLSVFLVDETIIGTKVLHANYKVNKEVKKLEGAILDSKREDLTDEEKAEILKRFNAAADRLIRL